MSDYMLICEVKYMGKRLRRYRAKARQAITDSQYDRAMWYDGACFAMERAISFFAKPYQLAVERSRR